jgi:hypothetical protein
MTALSSAVMESVMNMSTSFQEQTVMAADDLILLLSPTAITRSDLAIILRVSDPMAIE